MLCVSCQLPSPAGGERSNTSLFKSHKTREEEMTGGYIYTQVLYSFEILQVFSCLMLISDTLTLKTMNCKNVRFVTISTTHLNIKHGCHKVVVAHNKKIHNNNVITIYIDVWMCEKGMNPSGSICICMFRRTVMCGPQDSPHLSICINLRHGPFSKPTLANWRCSESVPFKQILRVSLSRPPKKWEGSPWSNDQSPVVKQTQRRWLWWFGNVWQIYGNWIKTSPVEGVMLSAKENVKSPHEGRLLKKSNTFHRGSPHHSPQSQEVKANHEWGPKSSSTYSSILVSRTSSLPN